MSLLVVLSLFVVLEAVAYISLLVTTARLLRAAIDIEVVWPVALFADMMFAKTLELFALTFDANVLIGYNWLLVMHNDIDVGALLVLIELSAKRLQ